MIRVDPSFPLHLVAIILTIIILIQEISETLALAELAARPVSAAGTAAAETILSGLNTLAENHPVDEAEVEGQKCIVDEVDDGDGECLVGWE